MYSLILGMALIMLLAYAVSKFDLINPVFLCSASFMISILSAYYNKDVWGISLGAETIALILTSMGAMLLCGWGTQSIMKASDVKVKLRQIKIGNFKLITVLGLSLITAYMYVKEILRIAAKNGMGNGSINSVMNIYRYVSHFETIDAENQVSWLASNLMQFTTAFAYLIGYVIINNFLAEDRKKHSKGEFDTSQWLKIFVVCIYLVITLLTGARMRILKYILYLFIVYMLLLKRKTGWKLKISLKQMALICLIAVCSLAIFMQLKTVVGRTTTLDPLSYITMYMGGSIELLDLFIKNPLEKSNIVGKETFYQIYNFLGSRVGNSDWIYTFAKEFRKSTTGITVGNVYTALRSFYYDFGFIGAVIASGVVGAGFSYWYNKINKRAHVHNIDMSIVFYAYLSYSYFFYGVNYYFDFLSFNFLKMLVYFFIARCFFNASLLSGFRICIKRNVVDNGRRNSDLS